MANNNPRPQAASNAPHIAAPAALADRLEGLGRRLHRVVGTTCTTPINAERAVVELVATIEAARAQLDDLGAGLRRLA